MCKCLLYYKKNTGGQKNGEICIYRVSTKEQSIDRQLLALEPYQIKKKNIYCDYQSGQQVICGIVEKLQRMQLAKNRGVKLTLVQDVEKQAQKKFRQQDISIQNCVMR